MSLAVHICLRQFRIDVLYTVSNEIRLERRDEALLAEQGLSYRYLNEVLSDGCYIISGNYTGYYSASKLFDFLFGIGNRL